MNSLLTYLTISSLFLEEQPVLSIGWRLLVTGEIHEDLLEEGHHVVVEVLECQIPETEYFVGVKIFQIPKDPLYIGISIYDSSASIYRVKLISYRYWRMPVLYLCSLITFFPPYKIFSIKYLQILSRSP